MNRATFFLLLAGCLLASASAARIVSDGFDDVQPSLRSLVNMIDRSRKSEIEDLPSLQCMMYKVLPSEATDFEDAWLKLAKDVEKYEKNADEFKLFKILTDNLYYISTGRWRDHLDMHEHIMSRHFQDFSDFVDDREIRWEMHELIDMSEDLEEKYGKRETSENRKGKTMFHALTKYTVPPNHQDKFEDAWLDSAKDTLKESGNVRYSLRKVFTDNTHYYTCGAWESHSDFMDHQNSKHLGRLHDFVDDKDITWFVYPLETVGYART
jgi:quinol monooxygenase YgiN